MFRGITLLQCNLDLPMTNDQMMLPPLRYTFQVYWIPLHMESNRGLHFIAKGIEKKRISDISSSKLLGCLGLHIGVLACLVQ